MCVWVWVCAWCHRRPWVPWAGLTVESAGNTGPQQEQCMLVTSKLSPFSFLKTVSVAHAGLKLTVFGIETSNLFVLLPQPSEIWDTVCVTVTVSVWLSLAWSHLGWTAFWCTLAYTFPLPLFVFILLSSFSFLICRCSQCILKKTLVVIYSLSTFQLVASPTSFPSFGIFSEVL